MGNVFASEMQNSNPSFDQFSSAVEVNAVHPEPQYVWYDGSKLPMLPKLSDFLSES